MNKIYAQHLIIDDRSFRILQCVIPLRCINHLFWCELRSKWGTFFKNRRTCCRALVLPGDFKPIFGTIPLSDMDLIVQPQLQELLVNPKHPHIAQMLLPGIR
jgi:hypothetical protein